MPINMLIHDQRLHGRSPAIADNQYEVDGTVPISHIVDWTQTVARGSGFIKKLVIMAHGSGYGIQLGREWLTLKTVDRFSALKGLVKSVILYSCSAARTEPYRRMTEGDGALLISRLAVRMNCYVVASSSTQWYTPGTSQQQPIDFGAWEGDVYLFGPNGNKQLLDSWIPDDLE
jgi:hypothetical protein